MITAMHGWAKGASMTTTCFMDAQLKVDMIMGLLSSSGRQVNSNFRGKLESFLKHAVSIHTSDEAPAAAGVLLICSRPASRHRPMLHAAAYCCSNACVAS